MPSQINRTPIQRNFAHRFFAVCATITAIASVAFGQQPAAHTPGSAGSTAYLTYQGNMARQGWNSAETILNQTNVNPNTFGLLFALPVDGQIYAQPLYVQNVILPNGSPHNIVFVCTEHNSVYAFDADTNQAPLWHVNLGPSVPNGDTGTSDINPEVGITGTPVIKPIGEGIGYLYVVAKTKETDQNGDTVYVQRLHALDITSGAEMTGSPAIITASVPGTGDGSDGTNVAFNPLVQAQRPGLLLLNGTIYIGWASHGDNGPYHGWIMAYDAGTLAQTAVFNTTPNAVSGTDGGLAAGGIWQGGGALASDGTNIFVATGNGLFDTPSASYGDSILKILTSNGLSLGDYFTPADQLSLDQNDGDLGSGGVMILPASLGANGNQILLTQTGKEGTVRLLPLSNLGQYHTTDQTADELQGVIGGIWGNPAMYNGNIYYGGSGWPIAEFTVSNGLFTTTSPVNTTSNGFGYPGPTPTVSSNGTTNGIVWAIDTSGYSNNSPAYLWAYNADTLATLYSNTVNPVRDALPAPTKFSVPLVINGKVYVGASGSVSVFGIGSWTAAPTFSKGSGVYHSTISVTITDATAGAKIYYTTNGTVPTQSSTLVTGPVTVSTSETLTARAFATGYTPGSTQSANYQISPMIGTGNGLTGNYYNGMTLSGAILGTQVAPTINFNWAGNSPISGVPGTQWSAKFTGTVEAESTGAYTFQLESDDGCELYVNGTRVIDGWVDQPPTYYNSNPVNLVAGQKYSIVVYYYQDGGGSLLQLNWSGPGMPLQLIPESQLYSASYPFEALSVTGPVIGGGNASGSVGLATAAGAGGNVISLASSSTDAQVPTSVTIPSGYKGAAFTVTTSSVTAPVTVTITATFNSVSIATPLTVNPYPIASLTLAASSISAGSSTTGQVNLPLAAPAGGTAVTLASNDSNVQVPTSVTVPAGYKGAAFKVTSSAVTSTQNATITATLGTATKQAVLTITPSVAILNFSVTPTSVTGGASATCQLNLTVHAPAGGEVISLSSSSTAVQVPTTVTVPAGYQGVSFKITTTTVNTSTPVTITATLGSSTGQTTITVNP